jgi:3-phosphoshikimate 1-carboxyvinyltransferase
MGRILTPLKLMGARVLDCAPDERMPLTLAGSAPAIAIEYRPEMASAQVKSAVLLAGLNAIGRTTVVERLATRDHTERLLRHFGVPVEVSEQADGWHISVEGEADPVANDVQIAGDPSSAAFPLVAALLVPGSRVTAENVLLNEARSGLFTTLTEMGAKLTIENEREAGGERVADLRAEYAPLRGVEVPPERAPSMIDEYPVLAVAAAFADGATIMRGVGELRVKESDRLQAILDGLAANGVAARADGEDLTVEGGSAPGTVRGGGLVTTHMDHRIAMAFLVMGLASAEPVRIDDAAMIATSFPGFIEAMGSLGADLAPAAEEPAS